MNTGAPTKLVRMPSGISLVVMLRAIPSTSMRNVPTHEHRGRDQAPVVIAEQQPAEMRDHQSDPADHAADRDAGRGNERRAENDGKAQPVRVHAQRARLRLAHGQQIHAPAQQEQRHGTEQDRHEREQQILVFDRAERAHQPVGDRRELVFRVRHELDEGRSGGKQRGDHHAREHERERALELGKPADRIGQKNRQKPEAEGHDGDAEIG